MAGRAHYVTEYDDLRVTATADVVIVEDDPAPRWSGLLDAQGRKLYRRPDERVPMGFQAGGPRA